MNKNPKNKKNYLRSGLIFLICLVLFLNYLLVISTIRIKGENSGLQNNKTMPPTLTLITVALGPIRGLIADALWWHVSDLQEEGEFFEILKLTDWITALQPENPFVWTYHAWNLAYNVAYEFPTPKSRWEWILSSIKLLRDDGLKLNPDSTIIKNELAWIFVDRVSGTSDPQSEYYCQEWAGIMGKYMKSGNRQEIIEMAEVPVSPENQAKGDLFNRTNAMRKEMKIDTGKMLEIDKDYGPFNWLLPQATAVYWGKRDNASETTSRSDLNFKVVIPVAMQQSFLKGSIVSDPESGLFVTTNNFDIAPNVIKVFRKREETSPRPDLEEANCLMFLINAIPILYAFNEIKSANLLFDEYNRLRPENKVDLHNFIINQFLRLEQEGAARYKQSLIEITLYNAYKTLASGNSKKAADFAETAEKAWEKHQQKYGNGMLKLPPFDSIKAAALCKAFSHLETQEKKMAVIKLAGNKNAGKLFIKNAADLSYNGKKLMN